MPRGILIRDFLAPSSDGPTLGHLLRGCQNRNRQRCAF